MGVGLIYGHFPNAISNYGDADGGGDGGNIYIYI